MVKTPAALVILLGTSNKECLVCFT